MAAVEPRRNEGSERLARGVRELGDHAAEANLERMRMKREVGARDRDPPPSTAHSGWTAMIRDDACGHRREVTESCGREREDCWRDEAGPADAGPGHVSSSSMFQ